MKKKVVKKKIVKKKAVKSTQLDLFLRALAELYPTDCLTPGLVVAYLPRYTPDSGSYYASMVRYEGTQSAHRKVVLYRAYNQTITATINDLVRQWLEATKSVQVLRARKSLRGGKSKVLR